MIDPTPMTLYPLPKVTSTPTPTNILAGCGPEICFYFCAVWHGSAIALLIFIRVFQMSRPIERLSDMLMIILLNTTGLCTSYAHACINPIIYTFAAPPFRKHIFKDIKCFVSQAVKKLYCCPKTQDQAYALERISDPAGKSILNVQDGPSSTGVTSVHLCSNGNSRNFEETRS